MKFYLRRRAGRVMAYPSTCPEIPAGRERRDANQWQEFDSLPAVESAMADLKAYGYDVQWCKCQVCRTQ